MSFQLIIKNSRLLNHLRHMKFVTRPAPNKLTPAPNPHKMMQRMAIDRATCHQNQD